MARSLVCTSFFLLASVGVLLLSGCGEQKPVTSANSQFKPADTTTEGGSETTKGDEADGKNGTSGAATAGNEQGTKPKAVSVDKLDAESLPDGPAEEILAFMRQLDGYQARGVTREAQRADTIRVLRLMMEAGDRVLIDKEASPEQRAEAAKIKLSAVMELANRGEPKADEELLAYSQRLKKDKSPEISHMGRSILFSMEVAKLQNGDTDDPQPVIDELKELLKGEDPEHVTFMIGNQAAMALTQLGKNEAAVEAMQLLGEKYQDDKDENVAAQAKQLLKQTKLVQLDFRGKLTALFADKPDPKAAEELMTAVQTLVGDKDAGAMELSVASQTADILERTENYDAAKQVIALISERFGSSEDEKIAADAKEAVDDAGKRLALIGQPLDVTGQTIDGQAFDAKTLEGKVVLIDFWATWCGPCLAEIPNIKKYYEQYKDKGFEVIGYNLDDKQQDVDQFFATQKLPWPTVVSGDAEMKGFDSPLAKHCGVKSIPFLVLLNAEGKVIALHPRGEKLGEKLAELLGPVEGATPPADGAAPPAEGAAPAPEEKAAGE